MIAMLAVLEFTDFAIIAGIVVVFASSAAYTSRNTATEQRLERQVLDLQRKMDALLKFHNVPMPSPPPSGMSPELELMACIPEQKIAAIKLYREQNPGTGLAEAKNRIEEYARSRK